MTAQLEQTEAVTIHYFKLKGAAGLATLCFEQGGIEYNAKSYSFPEWGDFKPKTPTGKMFCWEMNECGNVQCCATYCVSTTTQGMCSKIEMISPIQLKSTTGLMPLIEYSDGTMIAESGAIARVAAARAGLLGVGRDFARSEMLIGMTSDLWKLVGGNAPTVITVAPGGAFTPEKAEAWVKEWKPKIKTSVERYVKLLLDGGDRFTTKGELIGELELWYRLYQLIEGPYAEILDEVPALKPFYARMSALTGPKKLHENQTKFGELPNYFVPMP